VTVDLSSERSSSSLVIPSGVFPKKNVVEESVFVAPQRQARDGKPGLANFVGCVTASTALRFARNDKDGGSPCGVP